MRELVQQSASSSTELSAAAEQMLKLSRNLLDSMDRFALDRFGAYRQLARKTVAHAVLRNRRGFGRVRIRRLVRP